MSDRISDPTVIGLVSDYLFCATGIYVVNLSYQANQANIFIVKSFTAVFALVSGCVGYHMTPASSAGITSHESIFFVSACDLGLALWLSAFWLHKSRVSRNVITWPYYQRAVRSFLHLFTSTG